MRCVIADDSRVERWQVRRFLEEAGHEVVAECENGEKAVAAVKEHVPDLVVLDVVMPRMTGDAAGQAIREFSDCAMIFATKNTQTALQEVAAKTRAAIAGKPYAQAKFNAALEQACGNRR